MKQEERTALSNWEEYKADISNSTPVDVNMSQAEREKHRLYLEAHPVEWIQFFFPKYAKYPFAPFHKKAINRMLNNDEWYEVLSWSRELAKSTVVMFCVMYLALTSRKKNVMLASATQDSAKRLLDPYRANFEANGRIKAYYGDQFSLGSWTDTEFIAKCGCAFRAIGAGNAPRGSRNEAVRPDVLLVDDFDTDEECRNPDIVNKKWEWYEQAFYATRSISEPTLIVWCGNIIARDCCVARAAALADHHDLVNIRNKDGHSTWPEKNTEEHIDTTLRKISVASAQKEYYNNPVTEGEVFKEISYGRVPDLKKFPFLVIYGDPAPGENKTKNSSTKSCVLMGQLKDKVYIINARLDRGLNADFIDWYVQLLEHVDGKTPVYCYMENNKLQDPFFQQVFKPLVGKARRDKHIQLYINPDEERKTEKGTRIEANLEPINREGNLIFNEAEQDNPHMKRLEDQFKLFTLRLKFPADGPDCVEGGLRILKRKVQQLQPVVVERYNPKSNRHRL